MTTIGILNLQGDVSEHVEMTKMAIKKLKIDAKVIKVKIAPQITKCDGLIISGGESTTIGKLMIKNGIRDAILKSEVPIFGTCAGLVLLARKTDYKQPLLKLIDMEVVRNGFGRQKESFEEEIKFLDHKFPGVFIRAPYVKNVGENVDIIAKIDEKIVGVKKGKHIATAFHPELTGNTKIHEYFIKEVLNCVE
ncbi:MAG: pyridoxal 5'-phosphate synthase glutaminase subunit PdxT [Methanobacteriaceae archaeon]|nr:pyridoxal 5'-phosphate synthase glutaminase subunit PdxT [Methanobacteriaceae archaeon]